MVFWRNCLLRTTGVEVQDCERAQARYAFMCMLQAPPSADFPDMRIKSEEGNFF